MADIKTGVNPLFLREEDLRQGMELLYFAYRDFTAEPDAILARQNFGRAHHRVLHFVSRQPGLTIAELLDILRITKQSLNRVLKELIEKGFVESRMGSIDRRHRQLYVTASGDELAVRLAKLQTRRIMRALSGAPDELRDAASRFLLGMIDPSDRPVAARLAPGSQGDSP